jgi:hypothetical protein
MDHKEKIGDSLSLPAFAGVFIENIEENMSQFSYTNYWNSLVPNFVKGCLSPKSGGFHWEINQILTVEFKPKSLGELHPFWPIFNYFFNEVV